MDTFSPCQDAMKSSANLCNNDDIAGNNASPVPCMSDVEQLISLNATGNEDIQPSTSGPVFDTSFDDLWDSIAQETTEPSLQNTSTGAMPHVTSTTLDEQLSSYVFDESPSQPGHAATSHGHESQTLKVSSTV